MLSTSVRISRPRIQLHPTYLDFPEKSIFSWLSVSCQLDSIHSVIQHNLTAIQRKREFQQRIDCAISCTDFNSGSPHRHSRLRHWFRLAHRLGWLDFLPQVPLSNLTHPHYLLCLWLDLTTFNGRSYTSSSLVVGCSNSAINGYSHLLATASLWASVCRLDSRRLARVLSCSLAKLELWD
ncbi:uncharacterized protein LY79DRAFT_29559 [Colletotrichum navitas]|uniref:Uncharacterized protein n=1 Tax=Colletotrichum navitas TaxID=681940 RepID=A0AAD8VBW3_9PEZI|nr:uncharacterized protein LY79DRAFT_29559 [Colletotrichum navitas]KAK1600709.1 hypothetical protein LY79DRAFT_29559 [Colletotrichum navitas]